MRFCCLFAVFILLIGCAGIQQKPDLAEQGDRSAERHEPVTDADSPPAGSDASSEETIVDDLMDKDTVMPNETVTQPAETGPNDTPALSAETDAAQPKTATHADANQAASIPAATESNLEEAAQETATADTGTAGKVEHAGGGINDSGTGAGAVLKEGVSAAGEIAAAAGAALAEGDALAENGAAAASEPAAENAAAAEEVAASAENAAVEQEDAGKSIPESSSQVVFDSSAVPMAEPADDGLSLDLNSGTINRPEVREKTYLAEPLPPPLPDPLNYSEINKLIFSQIGDGLLPVHRSGSAVYLLHDIDGNGYADVFALALRVDRREDAEFANINDYNRLHRADRKAAKFYLRLFYQRNGTLLPGDLVSLGERLVMDSFYPQAIVEGKNLPFAVSIVFTTLQGRVREWVIFSGGKPGRFSMQERAGEIPRVEDIDSDGVIDVVIYEKSYEIGIGNETYLTWYGWDGNGFSRRATVNVVRNLRGFLETAFELIGQEEWNDFSDHGFSDTMRGIAAEEEYSGFSVFKHVFTLAAVDESFKNQAIHEGEVIKRVIYLEIRENPFSQRDSIGFFFPLSVRFETNTGRNHLYTTRVYMLSNPFQEHQFSFSFEED